MRRVASTMSTATLNRIAAACYSPGPRQDRRTACQRSPRGSAVGRWPGPHQRSTVPTLVAPSGWHWGRFVRHHDRPDLCGRSAAAWGPFRGKYVVVWRREQGSWRMQLDIWNSGPAPES